MVHPYMLGRISTQKKLQFRKILSPNHCVLQLPQNTESNNSYLSKCIGYESFHVVRFLLQLIEYMFSSSGIDSFIIDHPVPFLSVLLNRF